jgi:hypothetical protein
MASIIERVGALAGTEVSQAVDLAHTTFQGRLGEHGHTGRALVETVAEICRNHPNLVGVGAGLLVEQLLVREKEMHDARMAETLAADPAAPQLAGPDARADGAEGAVAPPVPHRHIGPHLADLRPGRAAMEVFGALLLLKLAAAGAKMFRRKQAREVWFAPAAKIRLFSGSIAAYNLVSAIRSPKISAWRNGAILFFGTDALKPILKPARKPLRRRA